MNTEETLTKYLKANKAFIRTVESLTREKIGFNQFVKEFERTEKGKLCLKNLDDTFGRDLLWLIFWLAKNTAVVEYFQDESAGDLQ